ncbi:hypothetical protein AB0C65_32865 [Nocardia sp. NPDC048505]|uniref:hypothetical protein n=1 Tax=Nocardia sp. NPDC048505 TaxID=3155756 RepID=UPI0033DDC8CE
MSREPEPMNGASIVHRHWPLDGPHSPDTVAAAGEAVAELNRYLARATRSGREVLPYAHDGYRLAGNLRAAATSQAQVHRQLGTWARSLTDDPGLGDDEHPGDREPAVEKARTAAVTFDLADRAMFEIDRLLDSAQAPLGHLYHEMGWGLDR